MHENSPAQSPLHHEMIIAGYGGQGVLKMGQTFADAALLEGFEVVWTPAYGPEMRGGPAFCTVIVSTHPIGAPVISEADTAIIMDRPSLGKYLAQVRLSGHLLFNSSLIEPALVCADHRAFAIAANQIAETIGSPLIGNMVMLGAFLELTPLVSPASVLKALSASLPERRQHLLPMNERALTAGMEAMRVLRTG